MQDRFNLRLYSKELQDYVDLKMVYYNHGKIEYMVIENYKKSCDIQLSVNDLGKKYILEQCTGVKDYLDKLIYEGDIIKNLRTKNSCYKVVAEKNDYSFKFVGNNGIEKISCFEKYAVIGNIHQNPELLEE